MIDEFLIAEKALVDEQLEKYFNYLHKEEKELKNLNKNVIIKICNLLNHIKV